jgi:hypothetical protein
MRAMEERNCNAIRSRVREFSDTAEKPVLLRGIAQAVRNMHGSIAA